MKEKLLTDKNFDNERALYNIFDMSIVNCNFDGPLDGESALKECRDIFVDNCYFNLRYPLWHNHYVEINNCNMTQRCRAAIWYSEHFKIRNSKLHGIKALRECNDILIDNCDISSPEFGWSVKNLSIADSNIQSEYFLMRCENIQMRNSNFIGKYSFQYIKNSVIENCILNTKDAFWHAENITIRNCELSGEYLGWYSDHLTFIDCKIVGTQPLCYCRNLKLINCRMENTDLCFEKSDVNAQIDSHIDSIKNPGRGIIKAISVGDFIIDNKNECLCEFLIG